MRMQRFGPTTPIAHDDDLEVVSTPVGEQCFQCEETIQQGDIGFMMAVLDDKPSMRPVHHACMLRSIIGGVNHQRGTCTCCGGTDDPDPPGMTRRQAAEAAMKEFMAHRH